MEITINVEGVTLDSVIGYRYDSDEDRQVPETLGDRLVSQLAREIARTPEWGTLRERVAALRAEVVHERVLVEVESALSGPVELTSRYGEPTGKTTTLREEIVRLAGEALKMDRSNTYRNPTSAEKVIREQVDLAMAKELAAIVAEEKAKVVAAVRAKAADLIATAVKEGVGR
jgi:hypothetical protein